MRVKDIGEFQLIDLLAQTLDARDASPVDNVEDTRLRLRVPIGDDAAAWDAPAGTTALTTDTLVEGVHFDLGRTIWRDLGWKSLAVSLSDLAAMGCLPAFSVVTLGLRGDLPVDGLVETYRGMTEACHHYGGVVVGGDVVRSPVLFVTVAMTGTPESGDGPLLRRGAAQPGDQIAVTGSLGSSAGGLKMLAEGLMFDDATASRLRDAHNRPAPRVREGALLRRSGVLAAIDVSDGLVDDLVKLCEASGVGARLRSAQLPVDDILKGAFPRDWLSMALSGGEDYELLLTAPPPVIGEVISTLDIPVAIVGEIVSEAEGVTVLDSSGEPMAVERGGWDHFAEA